MHLRVSVCNSLYYNILKFNRVNKGAARTFRSAVDIFFTDVRLWPIGDCKIVRFFSGKILTEIAFKNNMVAPTGGNALRSEGSAKK